MWKMEITNCICCTQKEDIDPALIPRPGMSFKDRNEARAFYEAYAKKAGFGLSYGNSKTYSYIIHYSNEGVHTCFKKDEDLHVRNNTSRKTLHVQDEAKKDL
jgi:hypothetical protein